MLAWEGCLNVRELGGLPTEDGGETVFGRVVRGDNPEQLTAAGWASLADYGVRTVVDLRAAGAWPSFAAYGALADDQASDAGPPDGLDVEIVRDRKSTRLNSSHIQKSRMPSSA